MRVGLRQASEQGTTYFRPWPGRSWRWWNCTGGTSSAAAAVVGRSRAVSPPAIGFYGESAIVQARARVTEAQGQPEAALETLTAACRETARLHRMLLEDPTVAPWWIRVALSTGNRPLAGEVVVAIEHLARINGQLPSLTSSAVHAGCSRRTWPPYGQPPAVTCTRGPALLRRRGCRTPGQLRVITPWPGCVPLRGSRWIQQAGAARDVSRRRPGAPAL